MPDAMYPEIAANDAQREEWVRLFAIDEIETTDGDIVNAATTAYSVPLTVEFLKQNPFLVLDTAFFSTEFIEQLIDSIDGLDEKLDGLVVNSENYQCLNLLQGRYREQIDTVYIDPPYNTEDDRKTGKFLYKDCFENSSWLAMMNQTTKLSYGYISNVGSFFASCDENELFNFTPMLINLFGKNNFVENICWNKRIPKNDKGIGNIHEYILLFSKNKEQRKQILENSSYVMRKEAINEIYELLENMKLNHIPLHKAQEELKRFYKEQDFDRGITLYCELDENYEPWGKINMSWPNAKTYGPRYTIINPLTSKPVPVPQRGWRWKEETFNEALNDGEEFILPDGSMMKGKIWFANNDHTQPSSITYLKDVEHFLLRSVISLKSDGSIILDNMGLGDAFDYPKPVNLIKTLIYSTQNKNMIVLDYFAGSGTTAHAVINLNCEDGGSRKYILVEMGEYFDTVTKPRIEKVIYSEDWKDGKPVSRKGSSHAFKYLRLESYEDTLNNIVLSGGNYDLLGAAAEGYMLSYMLSTESVGSASLLNVEKLDKPFSYKMNITRNLESTECNIDLVETFNYLIGLTVVRSHALVSYDADFATGEYGAVTATLKTGDSFKFKAVEGTAPNGDKTLVIWREMTGDIEKDNAALDAYFLSLPNARSFRRIYVNCDNNLLNLRSNGENWQVVLIDEEMKKRMFENAE
ncbi:MAG: site-specific DNA-methyltransferase [Syntrophomonadales bacterium]